MEGPLENEDQPWEWIVKDEEFYYNIPDGDKLPLPPLTKIQGQFWNWHAGLKHGIPL